MLDTFLVTILLGVALIYLGRRAYRAMTASKSSNSTCSSCPSCQGKTPPAK